MGGTLTPLFLFPNDVFVHIPYAPTLEAQYINWLRVSDTAERSQVDQRIGHQLHAIVPLLDAFKAEQESLELVFPRKGPFDTHPQRMDGGVEEAFAQFLRLCSAYNLAEARRISSPLQGASPAKTRLLRGFSCP